MLKPVLGRFSLSVGALLVAAAMPVSAASIEESLALSMSKGLQSRMFWNIQAVSTKTKTKSEQPRDLTPEIVSIRDLTAMRNQKGLDLYNRLVADGELSLTQEQFFSALNSNTPLQTTNTALPFYQDIVDIRNALQSTDDLVDLVKVRFYGYPSPTQLTAVALLDRALQDDYGFAVEQGYLTTPQGIRARSGNPSDTLALSVGFYLNDEQNWAVEALVLGAPLRASIYGAGTNDRGETNGLDGKEIIQTKLLPPIAKFGYYFGDRSWSVRPYLGVAAMYSIFFDTKTTPFFDGYQGGKTSISLKNSFGVGPFVGLQSDVANTGWRVGLSVGRIKFKTEATLVTRNTMFKTDDLALKDYKDVTLEAIDNGEALIVPQADTAMRAVNTRLGNIFTLPASFVPGSNFTTELIKDLAAYKQAFQGGDGSLGTFVRKQNTTLDNTIFMLSIGKTF